MNMNRVERYKTTRLNLEWNYEDQNEYGESTDGEELPDYIFLKEKEEGYTLEELEDLVEVEELEYGYKIEYWDIDDNVEEG